MYYHYVFKTYNSRYVLIDKDLVNDLYEYFYKIAEEKGFKIRKVAILGDHVHLLIQQKENDNPSYIMKVTKGISAREIFKKYKTDRLFYRKLWGRSFYAEKVEPKDLIKVDNYIKGQFKSGEDKRFKEIIKARNREVHLPVRQAGSQVPATGRSLEPET
ncbi:MAG: IS200/IS605 family transposase [Candidatus Saganbacteria bacterium]|nr:IS200/IS605 family transposase [Candidatus Saganbacteria bacterium]